ncbi:MAG: hypothetical protein DRI46_11870 [Chloroflexi bacterium]|nr:MAG: hypothetical protein DRI46_11870 [Chloroflexota bacterium]
MKDFIKRIEGQVMFWWNQNRSNYEITETSDTWLHPVAWTIHALAKITSLMFSWRLTYAKKPAYLSDSKIQKLKDKYYLYIELAKKHQNKHGFFNHKHCDATLTTGLLSMIPEFNIQLEVARTNDGFWRRRQLDNPCYPKNSGSTISRDMMIGIYWYLWENKRLHLAESTLKHAKAHSYVLGLGDPARLVMMPPGEATLAALINKLGGKRRFFTDRQLKPWPKDMRSYHVHLLMMNGLLHGKIYGKIPSSLFSTFKHYAEAEHNKNNPLHQYAHSIYSDGDLTDSVDLLLNEQWWPSNKLPTRRERENDWVTSRDGDEGGAWYPATDDLDKEHNGGDFLIVAHLILKDLEVI